MFQCVMIVERPLIDEVLRALLALDELDVGHGRINFWARSGRYLDHCSGARSMSKTHVLVQERLAGKNLMTGVALEDPDGDILGGHDLRLADDVDF